MSIYRGESPRRRQVRTRAEIAHALVDAAIEILRNTGYEALTIRSAAVRAGIGRATAYAYFASKNHLIAEVYWHCVSAIEPPDTQSEDACSRVTAVLHQLALLASDEQALACAVTTAMCSPDPHADLLRPKIARKVHDLITAAVASEGNPDLVEVLENIYLGALVCAGTDRGFSNAEVAAHLEHAVLHIFEMSAAL